MYCIVNIYCPNNKQERTNFMVETTDFIKNHCISIDNLIVGGDFNSIISELDRATSNVKLENTVFTNVLHSNDLTDVWRRKNPDTREYSFIDPSKRGRNSRIDYVCTAQMLYKSVIKCYITNAPAPDHKAVVCIINLVECDRGKGYWKLNSSIIKDQEYQQLINGIIENTCDTYQGILSDGHLWELLKLRIKEHSIRYCVLKARRKKDEAKEIEYKLNILDKKIAQNAQDINKLLQERDVLKQEFDLLLADKAKGAQIRSRAQWIEKGEKSNAYFLNLEKKRQSSNVIRSLKYKRKESSDNQGILDICKEFYSDLYSSKSANDKDVSNFVDNVKLNRILTNEERDLCEGMITHEEGDKAVKRMQCNRSPGIDGLNIEFYKHFWPKLKHIVINAFNESYDIQSLPESLRIAIMSLIFKKGDDEDLENYRPISLTNTDYKILAFILAARIQKVIHILINPDQVAYIENRYIGTNVRLIMDIFENCQEGILFNLDFKKAYDSLEWNFIFKCLKRYNFGPSLIQWIKLLYHKPLACVKNNGYISDTFELQRGVRQGCPVSCLIFILCIEFLAQSVRDNESITGIKLHTSSVKICQYADDATVFLSNIDELKECIVTINHFGKVSGMTLNKSKCEGLWLGNNRHLQVNCTLCDIKWPTAPIKCLGIYIGFDQHECNRLNWYNKIDKIDLLLQSWKKRDLTLFGKVQVIKSLALGSLIYTASLCPYPNDVISKTEKILYTFIWGQTEKIKRSTLIADKSNGGIKMIDVKTQFEALKAAWVPRLLKEQGDTCHWKELPLYYISKFGNNNYILKTSMIDTKMCKHIKKIPTFYQEVIVSYNKSKIVNENNLDINQPLFGNRLLTYGKEGQKQCPYFINWINSGLCSVKDLRLINGKIDEHYIYEKVQNKANIYVEICTIQKCLNPYKFNIGTNEPQHDRNETLPLFVNGDKDYIDITMKKSKFFYTTLLKQIVLPPRSNVAWREQFINKEIDFERVYYKKVVEIKDLKLAETNYKLLHNILPCGENLRKWRKRPNAICDICGAHDTVCHLIFECIYAREIWDFVHHILDSEINLFDIVCGTDISNHNNFIISVFVYLIYKEWLVLSLDNKVRKQQVCWSYYKNELNWRSKVYSNVNTLSVYAATMAYASNEVIIR